MSIGHHVPQRHIPVIKGDVNFINGAEQLDDYHDDEAVPSYYIKEILDRLSQSSIDSIDHEDALEFLYDLFYMHSLYNQDDSRIARLFIEHDYCSLVHQCLIQYMTHGIFTSTSVRRSTQFILYTLWNFAGISIEFRLYLSNNQALVDFLMHIFLAHLIDLEVEEAYRPVKANLIQSIVSLVHNLTLNIHHLNVERTFQLIEQLLLKEEAMKSNERFRITLLLCLINLHPKRVDQKLSGSDAVVYQSTMKLLFRFLKKAVQQETLMMRTGLSAWIMAYAINKMPADVILEDDNRLYSFMILLKRGMREEKLQAHVALNRCITHSVHAKELVEKDATCWSVFQQFKIFLAEDEPTSSH